MWLSPYAVRLCGVAKAIKPITVETTAWERNSKSSFRFVTNLSMIYVEAGQELLFLNNVPGERRGEKLSTSQLGVKARQLR